jgi:methionyl-tRNA formyltransferase
LESGQNQVIIQHEPSATYCKKIQKADAKINFSDNAEGVIRLINAMSPSPAAFCNFNSSPVNIYKARLYPDTAEGKVGEVVYADKQKGIVVKCGQGAIEIISAQFAGGKPIAKADILNGRKLKAGDILD